MFESLRSLDALVIATVLYIVYRAYKARNNGPLPPGPKGWPLLGCIHMPIEYFWIKYAELGQIYGEYLTASSTVTSADL